MIDPVFLNAPVLPCPPLGQVLGCSVTLKVETLNPVGSFKGRGTETVTTVAQRTGASHLVCASAGNLGQALAYSGSRRDLATCEGAGTIGLELVRDDPDLDVVLVALGGGGMASGVAYAVRSLADHTVVIGIQPVGAPAMALSWRQGTVVDTDRIETIETIADGVAGGCPIPEVLEDLLVVLDDVMLVGEDSIKAGMRALYQHAGLVVEPSAALGIAAILEQPELFAGRRVTTILCGSNVDPDDFARWVLD